MKIKGKRTTVDYVDVEVDTSQILDIIREKLGFDKHSYVNVENGLFYRYEYDNHHNGDPEYSTREATAKETSDWVAFSIIRKVLK